MTDRQRVTGRAGGTVRRRKQKKRNKALILLIDMLLAGLFVLSLVMLTVEVVKYIRARRTYSGIRQAVSVTEETDALGTGGTEADTVIDADAETEADGDAASADGLHSKEEPAKRVLSAEPGISVNWEILKEDNPDMAAWLYCPGTIINYPVVLPDDNDYYIDHDFYGNEDECGALFFDCCTEPDASGPYNLIIYGHRRNDRSMFGMLSRWGNDSFRERFPVMYLMTPEHSYRVELFACRTINVDPKYFTMYFDSESDFSAYIDKALSQSYWTTDIEVQPDDIILTMVTCNKYDVTNDPRLLLHGRLVALD